MRLWAQQTLIAGIFTFKLPGSSRGRSQLLLREATTRTRQTEKKKAQRKANPGPADDAGPPLETPLNPARPRATSPDSAGPGGSRLNLLHGGKDVSRQQLKSSKFALSGRSSRR